MKGLRKVLLWLRRMDIVKAEVKSVQLDGVHQFSRLGQMVRALEQGQLKTGGPPGAGEAQNIKFDVDSPWISQ